jgi:hypothetical protein
MIEKAALDFGEYFAIFKMAARVRGPRLTVPRLELENPLPGSRFLIIFGTEPADILMLHLCGSTFSSLLW